MDMLEKSEDIIAYIKNSKKKTPVKIYIKGNLPKIKTNAKVFSSGELHFIIGDYEDIKNILNEYKKNKINPLQPQHWLESCYNVV